MRRMAEDKETDDTGSVKEGGWLKRLEANDEAMFTLKLRGNYLHGTETLERKRQRSIKLAELREIEDDLIKRGFIKCKRTVGRKPIR